MSSALVKKDYYRVLQLPPRVAPAIVKQRFRRLARRYHPDVNASPDAGQKFREIREAYDVLSDPAKRAIVDTWYTLKRGSQLRKEARRRAAAAPVASDRGSHPEAPGADDTTYLARKAPWWANATSEAFVGFGCFGLPVALVAFVLAFGSHDATLDSVIQLSLAIGLIFGLVATIGGSRFREALLQLLDDLRPILSWIFWWW